MATKKLVNSTHQGTSKCHFLFDASCRQDKRIKNYRTRKGDFYILLFLFFYTGVDHLETCRTMSTQLDTIKGGVTRRKNTLPLIMCQKIVLENAVVMYFIS